MVQQSCNADVIELDSMAADSCDLIFLDDTSYEFVGGGDAFNGY